jgi:hypothetical protein
MLDEKLELALLRKSMWAVQNRAVRSFCLAAAEQLMSDRQASGAAVNSTLSDHESHEERAHSRRYLAAGLSRPTCRLSRTRTAVLLSGVETLTAGPI